MAVEGGRGLLRGRDQIIFASPDPLPTTLKRSGGYPIKHAYGMIPVCRKVVSSLEVESIPGWKKGRFQTGSRVDFSLAKG
ncbi:hypothetical protein FACS1894147_07430 [Spirochaetia bacterium]|nr:hypothetical protein FACS1894147_07430 [Spirochaetia bacterium]